MMTCKALILSFVLGIVNCSLFQLFKNSSILSDSLSLLWNPKTSFPAQDIPTCNYQELPKDVLKIIFYIVIDQEPPFYKALSTVCRDNCRFLIFGELLQLSARFFQYVTMMMTKQLDISMSLFNINGRKIPNVLRKHLPNVVIDILNQNSNAELLTHKHECSFIKAIFRYFQKELHGDNYHQIHDLLEFDYFEALILFFEDQRFGSLTPAAHLKLVRLYDECVSQLIQLCFFMIVDEFNKEHSAEAFCFAIFTMCPQILDQMADDKMSVRLYRLTIKFLERRGVNDVYVQNVINSWPLNSTRLPVFVTYGCIEMHPETKAGIMKKWRNESTLLRLCELFPPHAFTGTTVKLAQATVSIPEFNKVFEGTSLQAYRKCINAQMVQLERNDLAKAIFRCKVHGPEFTIDELEDLFRKLFLYETKTVLSTVGIQVCNTKIERSISQLCPPEFDEEEVNAVLEPYGGREYLGAIAQNYDDKMVQLMCAVTGSGPAVVQSMDTRKSTIKLLVPRSQREPLLAIVNESEKKDDLPFRNFYLFVKWAHESGQGEDILARLGGVMTVRMLIYCTMHATAEGDEEMIEVFSGEPLYIRDREPLVASLMDIFRKNTNSPASVQSFLNFYKALCKVIYKGKRMMVSAISRLLGIDDHYRTLTADAKSFMAAVLGILGPEFFTCDSIFAKVLRNEGVDDSRCLERLQEMRIKIDVKALRKWIITL